MIAVGVDVHKRQCHLAMQLEDGELACFGPRANIREEWRKLLTVLPPEAEIALEVSTSGYFALSVLEEAGWRDRAHWVHTAGIDSLRKQKTDRLDAERLARELSVAARDPLPEAWFPPRAIRELRLRARQRCWLAGLRAQAKNRLQSLLPMHGLRPAVTDVLGVVGRAGSFRPGRQFPIEPHQTGQVFLTGQQVCLEPVQGGGQSYTPLPDLL